MIDPLLSLYTEGDVNRLRAHLLHSTAWIQHQLTAYGDEQISRCWMVWLSQCGLSDCQEHVGLRSNGQSFHLITLKPREARHEVRLGLWSWNNGSYIKRLVCQVDTALMASALGKSESQLVDTLPDADPLIISDYDQQEHPHSVSVNPVDLVDLDPSVGQALEGWWSLWADMQLANIDRLYAPEAQIQVPGHAGPQDGAALMQYCSDWFVRMQRRFCQPESLLVDQEDPSSVAVLWHMEGDMVSPAGVRRVRVPMMNLIQIRDGLIYRDTLLVDPVAAQKWLEM